MIDVLAGINVERRPTDQPESLVRLVDIMPRLVPEGMTADYAIAQAARVSYGDGTKSVNDDTTLIRYLLRHKHTSPFEMIELKWHIKLPIFIARQWIRHRTASINEISGRYSEMKDVFYFPDANNVRSQSLTNKQCSGDNLPEDKSRTIIKKINDHCEWSHQLYKELLGAGVSREQARIVLPANLYTEWYWKIDLHNLMRFLMLRVDKHAQQEIRELSKLMYDILSEVCPITMAAFDDYIDMNNTVTLTRPEIEAIKSRMQTCGTNKRENSEFTEKLRKLGLL